MSWWHAPAEWMLIAVAAATWVSGILLLGTVGVRLLLARVRVEGDAEPGVMRSTTWIAVRRGESRD
jgi:hypothetical protein